MKQSVGLVVLQIIGIILGFVSVFVIAGDLPASVYAVLGIYNVISSTILVFSNTGIETNAIRNILNWLEKGELALIKKTVTQAIFYRTILSAIISLLLLIYCFYISKYKFSDKYLNLFIFMSFASIFRGTNDSIVLLLRAFNNYLAAAFITYSINVFGKIIALILFFYFGFFAYVSFIIVLPLLITVLVLYKLKDYISFDQVIGVNFFMDSMKSNKAFSLSSYISFVFNNLDQMIVSIFMKNDIIGSFTLAKNFFDIGKVFVENIFDPMIQNLVKYKENIKLLQKKIIRINKIKNILFILAIIIFFVFVGYLQNLIVLFNLENYKYLNIFLLIVYLSQIAHVLMKVKYNYIALFFPPKYYFILTLLYSILNIIPMIIILIFQVKFIFVSVLFANLVMILITNHLFKSEKLRLDL